MQLFNVITKDGNTFQFPAEAIKTIRDGEDTFVFDNKTKEEREEAKKDQSAWKMNKSYLKYGSIAAIYPEAAPGGTGKLTVILKNNKSFYIKASTFSLYSPDYNFYDEEGNHIKNIYLAAGEVIAIFSDDEYTNLIGIDIN